MSIRKIGGNIPIWAGIVSVIAGDGGTLHPDYRKRKTFVPSGSPALRKDGLIIPFQTFIIQSVDESGTNMKLIVYTGINRAPVVGELIGLFDEDKAPKLDGTEILSVKQLDSDGKLFEIEVKAGAFTGGSQLVNKVLVFSDEKKKGFKVVPNGYTYNDAYVGEEEHESCSIVRNHAEGIFINRTTGAEVADWLQKVIPLVMQIPE